MKIDDLEKIGQSPECLREHPKSRHRTHLSSKPIYHSRQSILESVDKFDPVNSPRLSQIRHDQTTFLHDSPTSRHHASPNIHPPPFHLPTNTKTTGEQEDDNKNPRPERRSRKPREGKERAFPPDQQKTSTYQQSHENKGGKRKRGGNLCQKQDRTAKEKEERRPSSGEGLHQRGNLELGGFFGWWVEPRWGGRQANSKRASLPRPQQASSEKEERRDSSCRAGQGRAGQKGTFWLDERKKIWRIPAPKTPRPGQRYFRGGGRRKGNAEEKRKRKRRRERGWSKPERPFNIVNPTITDDLY